MECATRHKIWTQTAREFLSGSGSGGHRYSAKADPPALRLVHDIDPAGPTTSMPALLQEQEEKWRKLWEADPGPPPPQIADSVW